MEGGKGYTEVGEGMLNLRYLRSRGTVEMNTEVKVVGEVKVGKQRLCRQQKKGALV